MKSWFAIGLSYTHTPENRCPPPHQNLTRKKVLFLVKNENFLINQHWELKIWKVMENQNKQHPIATPDSVSVSPPQKITVPKRHSGEHISLSPSASSPGNSPADSHSSPVHSKQNSGEHISLRNSPARSSLSSDHTTVNHSHESSPTNEKAPSPENKPPAAVVSWDVFREPSESTVVLEQPMAVVNRAVLEEEPKATVGAKTDPSAGVVEGGGGGSRRRRDRPSLSILRRGEREKTVKKAALGFRVFGFLFCLVSLSVMAADRNQGWALDSFDRYKEFR